jgi:glycosyltransferase involved in cell wall biosynthesis
MTDELKLTVWMNMPSFYQDSLFNALSSVDGVDLEVVFAGELHSWRTELGWERRSSYPRHRFLTSRYALSEAGRIVQSQPERFHVVNGIWAEPAFSRVLWTLASAGRQFAIYTEAPEPGCEGPWPLSALKKSFARLLARRGAALLAISHFAEEYYAQLGFDPRRIYPFGYFREAAAPGSEWVASARPAKAEIIFVGQLIRRKGIDVLIGAVEPLLRERADITVTLVGAGELEEELKRLVASKRLDSRIEFDGPVSPDNIQSRITKAEVLVLPSRWDGWGLVVNEALSAGVPVVVSDRCGAADLINPGENGFVFRSEDRDDLRYSLERVLDPVHRASMRAAAQKSGHLVSAEVAAGYVIECIRHLRGLKKEKPPAPWVAAEKTASVGV